MNKKTASRAGVEEFSLLLSVFGAGIFIAEYIPSNAKALVAGALFLIGTAIFAIATFKKS